MDEQSDLDETPVVEIGAALEHLQQVKEDTVKLILLMQRARDRQAPKSSRAHRREPPR